MVTAIRAMWAKKLEQYQNLGKLLRMVGPNAPTILLGTLFSMMESAVRPYCAETNTGYMAYGSLGFGLLSGAFTPETTFVDWDCSVGST